jgi:hypothetical protein
MKNGVRKEYDSPELTWEEKNPISYYYYTAVELEEVKRIVEELERAKSNQVPSYEKKNTGEKNSKKKGK